MTPDLFDRERIKHLSLDDLSKFVRDYPDAAKEHKDAVIDALAGHAETIGRLWDTVTGVDSTRTYNSASNVGTMNPRSMTYKFRKLAGYTYP